MRKAMRSSASSVVKATLKEQLLDEFPYVNLIEADLLDPSSIIRAVDQSDPDEFYNFGAVSQATVCNRFARSGWEALQPVCTALGKPFRLSKSTSAVRSISQ